LVHEFVRSILEDREPALGAERSYDIIAPGILAHSSALGKGRCLEVPCFEHLCGMKPKGRGL